MNKEQNINYGLKISKINILLLTFFSLVISAYLIKSDEVKPIQKTNFIKVNMVDEKYLERHDQLTFCVQIYEIMRDFEILKMKGYKLEELLNSIEKQNISDEKKAQFIQLANFVFKQEKVGYSEMLLRGCIKNKSFTI